MGDFFAIFIFQFLFFFLYEEYEIMFSLSTVLAVSQRSVNDKGCPLSFKICVKVIVLQY